MGLVIDNVKPVEQRIGMLILVLNIVLPGIGVAVYNVVAKDSRWLRVVVEFLLAWLVIPWIIAVIDGVKIMQAAQPATARATA